MPKKVLLADDSRLILKMIERILTTNGYQVVMASNGIEALTLFYNEAPDILLLDVFMPDINGDFICNILKEDPSTSSIPIILLTGKENEDNKFWGIAAGADLYLSKLDCNPKLLLGSVSELLKDATNVLEQQKLNLNQIFSKVCTFLNGKLNSLSLHKNIGLISQIVNEEEAFAELFKLLQYITSYQLGAIYYPNNNSIYLYSGKEIGEIWSDYICNQISIDSNTWSTCKINALLDNKNIDFTKEPKSFFYQPILFKEKELAHFILVSENENLFSDHVIEIFVELMSSITLFVTNQQIKIFRLSYGCAKIS